MNRIERPLQAGAEAKIHYGTPEYKIVRHGTFVICAVTGQPILLDDLKYWSVELQEAYATSDAMWKRFKDRAL
jgi:hypothetical protein